MARAASGRSSVYAVLLAAGVSHRYGAGNKLLAELNGVPLVRHVAERVLESRAAGVIVVTGFEAERVRAALSGLDLRFVENPDYREGLASSLRCGVSQLPKDESGAMIVLADMPGITPELVDRLIKTFEEAKGEKIVFPRRPDGGQGNPVLWPRRFFAELRSLTGDTGAKRLIAAHGDETLGIPVADENSFRDIDAPADLAAWGKKGGSEDQ